MLKNIIKNLRKKHDFTQKELAEYLHIQRSTYARYENGTNTMSFETLCKLADLYGVSTDFLLERKALKTQPYHNDFIYLFNHALPFIQDSVLTLLKNGHAYKNNKKKDYIRGDGERIPVVTNYIEGLGIHTNEKFFKGDFAFVAFDESMIDENIQIGDYVIFRPQGGVFHGETALLFVDDTILIRKVLIDKNKILLCPSNENYQTIVCSKDNLSIIGKMVGVINNRLSN